MQADLFTALTPPCGECPNLGQPIDSGICYCHGEMSFRWADDRVDGCTYRSRAIARFQPAQISRADNLRDLLESPRHCISEKDRKWLRAELRREERDAGSMSGALGATAKRAGAELGPGMPSPSPGEQP